MAVLSIIARLHIPAAKMPEIAARQAVREHRRLSLLLQRLVLLVRLGLVFLIEAERNLLRIVFG